MGMIKLSLTGKAAASTMVTTPATRSISIICIPDIKILNRNMVHKKNVIEPSRLLAKNLCQPHILPATAASESEIDIINTAVTAIVRSNRIQVAVAEIRYSVAPVM